MDVVLLLSHHLAIGIENTNTYRHLGGALSLSQLLLIDDFRLDHHLFIILCTDKERMAREEQILVGDNEIDITIETSTRKPTGIVRIAGIRLDGNLVSLAPFQELAQIDIETEVTIIGTSDRKSVV